MTLISSTAWIPEANERRKLRDKARSKFFSSLGVTPLKSLADLELSPSDQSKKIESLLKKANPQGDKDIAEALTVITRAFSSIQLGVGGATSGLAKTNFNMSDLLFDQLVETHFFDPAERKDGR